MDSYLSHSKCKDKVERIFLLQQHARAKAGSYLYVYGF